MTIAADLKPYKATKAIDPYGRRETGIMVIAGIVTRSHLATKRSSSVQALPGTQHGSNQHGGAHMATASNPDRIDQLKDELVEAIVELLTPLVVELREEVTA